MFSVAFASRATLQRSCKTIAPTHTSSTSKFCYCIYQFDNTLTYSFSLQCMLWLKFILGVHWKSVQNFHHLIFVSQYFFVTNTFNFYRFKSKKKWKLCDSNEKYYIICFKRYWHYILKVIICSSFRLWLAKWNEFEKKNRNKTASENQNWRKRNMKAELALIPKNMYIIRL